MLKLEELNEPESCFNRARMDEMIFVLLDRDLAAPIAIRAWINARIALGMNMPDDEKILHAHYCANEMEALQIARTREERLQRTMKDFQA